MTLKRQPRRKTPSRTRSTIKADRRLHHETLEKRELLAAGLGVDEGPRLISVSANSGEQFDLRDNNLLPVAPTELTFRFGGDLIDESTLAGIQFRRSGGDGSFNEGNEIDVTPGFLGFEQENGSNIIVARFAETLPDDQYVIDIAGFDDTNAGIVGLRDINGNLTCPVNPLDALRPSQQVRFDLEVGPRVLGVVPQPVETVANGSRVQRRDQVWVYFNEDPLSNPAAGEISSTAGSTLPVVNPDFYKLIFTGDTIESTDDPAALLPTDVTYNPALNRAVLTFSADLSELAPAAANGNVGTFRLRIGSGDALPLPPSILPSGGGSDDTFGQALPLGVNFGAGTQSVVVTDGLIRTEEAFLSAWPGQADAVGSRDQRRDTQVVGRFDTSTGINVFPYNFATLYGTDPQLTNAENAITNAQQQRAREVLQLYSERLGVTFVETENEGLQIVTGDLRAVVISADTGAGADTPLSIYRVNDNDPTQGVLVLDAGENWFDGYGLSPDSRPSWFVEAVRGIGSLLGIGNLFELPAGVGAGGSSPDEPNSIAFSQQFYPNLPVEPSFISESDIVLGQALHRPEANDVDFYSFSTSTSGRLSAETIAERLDGSSLLDTHLNLYRVDNGEHLLIARNDDFYSDDSFVGVDIEPGNYIIGVSASGNENYNGEVSGSGLGGVSEGRYELRVTFDASTSATILDTTGTQLDGDADGIEGGDFNFWFRVARDIATASTDSPRTIFVDKFGDDANDGSLGTPLESISAAFALAGEGDIVRLLPNGGLDGLITTVEDNEAYEIGTNAGSPLRDGAEFEVPKGVTVMIDAGAILKLQRAKISVGSESVDEDRSLAALQVLGTPVIAEANGVIGSGEVILTSYNNEAVGVDTNPLDTIPAPGNWAGIEFRNDFDNAEGRANWETEGIFLDYVSNANISFGGGSIAVNEPIVTPLQMAESRPTLIYNTITDSADAAISADPNSFLETNFHSPAFQRAASFTSDYDRVGPEISGNTLLNNSINGLFVRVNTPAAGQLEPMTVSGRFDDTDIVHTLSQVLILQGQPGGPLLLEQRPDVLSTTVTPGNAGDLSAGTYDFRVTYVDANGSESLASLPTVQATVAAGGSITLDALAPAPEEFTGRRLYRLDPATGNYVFVIQLDRRSTSYVDDGTTRGGILRSEQIPNSTPVTLAASATPGTLFPGNSLNYRITFVDSVGGESSASTPTTSFITPANGSIELSNLPAVPQGFVATRIYRLNVATGDYVLVAEQEAGDTVYVDDGTQLGGLLINNGTDGALLQPRLDARLSIDPGTIVKLQNSRIEAGFGADFYAEGVDGQEIVFTSRLDDTFGAGGTFDTNNDGISDNAAPADWGGLIFRQDSTASLDFTDVRFGGGSTPTQGAFTDFNAIEILQADVRITNSTIQDNAAGSVSTSTRGGFGFNDDAAIFVRGSQPIIVDNIIEGNAGAAISINPNALNHDDVLDVGRSTGRIDVIVTDQDNQGPLISGNRLDLNTINAIRVRSEVLTTESIWDDTDIVHYVDGQIISATHHFRSGLRLKSDPEQSLVVKHDQGAELIGTGIPLDIEDRIGGSLQVLGTPGNPVILTSVNDCTVGAGFTPDGRPMNDTLLGGACTTEIIIEPPTVPYVDIVIVMDESGSMGATQAFSAQFIEDLEAGLLAAGIGSIDGNRYGAVGFGSSGLGIEGRSLVVGNGLFGTATEYAAATSQFVIDGAREDGFAGIDFAIANYPFRADAAKFIILATDEPRSVINRNLNLNNTIANLQANDIRLQGIIGIDVANNNGQPALAIDNNLVYTQAGGGTFTTEPGGLITGGRSVADYLPLVQATGGIAGDLSQIGSTPGNASSTAFGQALVSSLVVQAGGTSNTGAGARGDWQGLTIDTFANDRNVALVIETEDAIPAANAANATADDSQRIGDLAAHEYAGDETERLGFNIRGTLADSSDNDVYSFTATGGTTVFLDIDDTSVGLDTLIELIDVNDNVLASSDDSFTESTDQTTLISNLPGNVVRPLFLTGVGNIEGPNPLDAGMRVVLPGSSNSENIYYVRVRSANGITKGQYTLSVRLREADETIGSTVQFADIRFATNAINVTGAPLRSPLTADAQERLDFTMIVDPTPTNPQSGDEFTQESANNRLGFNAADADALGNLLTTDRGSLLVTGEIGNISSTNADIRLEDVDVYQVDLFAQQIESDVFDSENRFVTTSFDVDYADGLGRVNTSLAVYNSAGQLILHSRDSNIADDVGRPLNGIDSTNLTAGSAAVLDAHIGPVELREGTYFVVVSNAATVPRALDQFINPNPTESTVRLAPINSVRRVVEDTLDEYIIRDDVDPPNGFNFDLFSDLNNYTAERPVVEAIFDDNSIVPYTLDDVRLFVSLDDGYAGNNQTSLVSVNPFTGIVERLIGQSTDATNDIALRSDGELFSYGLPPTNVVPTDANSGEYFNISPVNAAAANAGNDTITFQRSNEAGTGNEVDPNAQLLVNAVTYPLNDGSTVRTNPINVNSAGYLVGTRDTRGRGFEVPSELTRNLFYQTTVGNGNVTSRGSRLDNAHRNFGNGPYDVRFGSASNNAEFGVVDTGFIFETGGDAGDITGIGIDPSDGNNFFAVTDNGGVHSFNPRTNLPAPDTSAAFGYDSVIPTVFHGVVTLDPVHATTTFAAAPNFTGMAMGPRSIEGEAYRQTLFATTDDGWLYAIDIDELGQVTPANVFFNGRSAIPLTFSGGFSGLPSPTGLAFSHLEDNPWHQTTDRGRADTANGDFDHGVEIPDDRSRLDTNGSSSLYFGFERDGNPANNRIGNTDADNRGELAPGGSHGSVISRPFSLEGYSAADKPTLYFSYLLEVEDGDDYTLAREQNDSFRVFASGDDGVWQLLATNNNFRDLPNADEYDFFNDTNIPVQEIFDDTQDWRQARVDIGPLAGNENVRLRFDFSTAGAMRSHHGSIDFAAVPGDQVVDGQQITFLDDQFNTILFESVVGRNVVLPAGNLLDDQDQFSITGPDGVFNVRFVSGAPALPGDVQFTAAMTSQDVADAVLDVLPGSLNPTGNGDGSISVLAATSVNVAGDIPVGQSNPVQVERLDAPFFSDAADQLQIPDGSTLTAGESITVIGFNSSTTLTYVDVATGAPGEIVFTITDSADDIAQRVISQLPVSVGAVYEGNGIITFVNQTFVSVSPSVSQIAIDNLRTVSESRVQITAADGDNLIDGETLTFTSPAGTTVITFVDADAPGAPGEVNFRAGDTINTIVTRLFNALPSDLSPLRDGDDILVIASTVTSDVGGTAIQFGQFPSQLINLPDGAGLIDGEVLRFSSVTGTADITFLDSPTPGPAGTVNFEVGDSSAVIQSRLANALALDNVATGAGLVVYGATNATTITPGSNIVTGFVDGQQVVLPTGAELVDGEALDIVVGGTTTTITFIDTNAAVGANQVAFQAGDNAAAIAARFLAALDPNLNALRTNDRVVFTADSVTSQSGTSSISLTQGAFNLNVVNLDIPDAVDLRNGEQIQVFGNDFEEVTFILRGTTVADTGSIQVFYDPGDVAADLYAQIVTGLSDDYQVYIDPTGMGINIFNPTGNTSAFLGTSPISTVVRSEEINEFAIPITIPNGDEIVSGETLVITQKDDVNLTNVQTFTLVEINAATGAPNELNYNPTDSADAVALDILSQLPLSLQAYLVNSREIYLLNGSSVATEVGSGFISYESAVGAMPILVDSTLTTAQVAERLQAAFAEGLGRHATIDGTTTANPDDYKIYGSDRIRLYNATVLDGGAFGVSQYTVVNAGPITTSAVPGDEFGEGKSEAFASSEVETNSASNNDVEGVYIDDIVVGFAERGEMVLNAPTNDTTFIFNPETLPDSHPAAIQPERQNETLLGGYALEIRTSDEYGVEQDYDPINLELTEQSSLGRSFDTNDRLVDGAVTLIVQSSSTLLDGDTFTLDDGNQLMTFEFDNVLDGNITSGNVRIPFDTVNTDPAFTARAVRNAINSPQVQSVLDITAASSDSTESATPTGNRVELFGESIFVNHSGGRFLKVDLVAEETFQGRETSKQIPLVDHTTESVFNAILGDQTARAAVTSYVDGAVDTLVAVGKIGDQVNTGVNPGDLQDGAVVLPSDPTLDIDTVRVYLRAGQAIDIDVDTAGFTKAGSLLEVPVITVIGERRLGTVSPDNVLAQTSLFTGTAAPGETELGAFLQFQAPETGYYNVAISSPAAFGVSPGFGGFGGVGESGEYQLTIRPNAAASAAVPDRDVLMVDYQFGIGDQNRIAPQGQILISSNFISDSAQVGILATNAPRGETLVSDGGAIVNDVLPRPGSVALLRNQNTDGIIPGVVISNNVVTASGDAAIVLSGDTSANGQIAAPTVFGRILNNTVVGQGVGDGIRVSGSASPTILNNVVAFFNQGIATTANQTGEVIVGSNAYQNNNTDSTLPISTSSIIVPQEIDLFEDPARRVYIPASGSNVIDSSFASLPDRADFLQTVKEPVGISPSPIIAPNFDAYGQPRVDDPNVATPGGVGLNVFIDRGAIDRADTERPVAVLTGPQDAIGFAVAGGDQDVDQSFVRLADGIVEFFDVQLIDTAGTGLDPLTITSRNVILTENGRQLIPDVDYVFGYSTNSRTIRLTPSTGLWRNDSVYEITLNNRPRVEVTLPAGDQILDGEQVITIEEDGTQTTFEFDSGFSVQVPETLTLNFRGTNADLLDEEVLTITSPSGVTRTLEIDLDSFVEVGNTNIIIDASSAGTISGVRDAVAAALNSVDPLLGPLTVAEALELSPISFDANKIQLGTTAGHLVTQNIQSLVVTGTDSGLQDGDRFTYASADATVTFEFTDDALVSDPSFVPIAITRNDTPDQIAQAIANAISSAPLLGLAGAQSIGNGTTVVGGLPGDLLTIDQGSLGLLGTPGVTAGAFAVPFLPSPQFTSALAATALQAAIRNSTAGVNVFSPGAGTLLISGSQLVQSTFGGSAPSSIGTLLPAISDLAGNAVRETRITDETRFTIIMPDVVFDYGDAPASYGTLDADNGARHTVADERLPRLGTFLDTELDGRPFPGSDDAPLAISASETGNAFTITNPAANTSTILVSANALVGGETLTLNVDGVTNVFELSLATSNPASGNVPVSFVAGDTAANVAQNLSLAIRGRIAQIDESIIMTLDPTNATITLTAIDDEDGISTGTFISNNVPLQVFTVPGTSPTNVAGSDVIGFLNPLDPAGSTLAVSVLGSGLLDAWVDFDRNGTFDLDEQVIANEAVVDGVNLVTFSAPTNALDGDTWMRVRISESGNLTPTGVSVGGEVEDFQITVLPIALPTPVSDTFTAIEDTLLVVDSLSPQDDLFENDLDLNAQILPTRFFVGQQPVNGTLTVIDELSGEFTYLPDPDFYGEDTFTYRLSTQQNAGNNSAGSSTFATVTINVAPVNDLPGAQDQSFAQTEDTTLVIPAASLLVGATGHGSPAIATAPQNESDQVLNIASITAGGVSISNANPGSTVTTTEGGSLSAVFNIAGFITEVRYTPGLDFNRDNLPLAGGGPRLDGFSYTVVDDGALVLDDGTVVNSAPLTTTAQVSIEITPTNDSPLLATELISISDARYNAYFAGLAIPAPVPTEDTQLTIDGAFLLSNDLSGPATAADEQMFTNSNDGALQIVGVSLIDPSQGAIELLPSGNVLFTPADDIFGTVQFAYTAEDAGVNEAANNTRQIQPLRTTVTSAIFLEPINDVPVAYDRAFTLAEVVEPAASAALTFTAADLLNGQGVNVDSQFAVAGGQIVVPSGANIVNGETLTITGQDGLNRIVEFSTEATASIGTDVLVTFTTAETSDAVASNLVTALRASGLGGIANASTVSFLEIATIATDSFTTNVTASATNVSVPSGDMLVGGETVTIIDSTGQSLTVEFSKTGFSLSNNSALAAFASTDTAMEVAASLQQTLTANGFGSTIQAAVGGNWDVQFVNLPSVVVNEAASQLMLAANVLTLPDGGSVINGETISIDDGAGTVRVIEFNTTGTPSAGTDDVVIVTANDTATTVASSLATVLRLQNLGVTANGNTVTFNNVASSSTAAPATAIVATPASVAFPDGTSIVDGEIITLTLGDGSTATVEFVLSTSTATGQDFTVSLSPLDTATVIANRFVTQLRLAGHSVSANNAVATFVNVDTIAAEEISSAAGQFPATLAAPFNETEQALRVVAFATDLGTVDFAVLGNGTHQLATVAGGTLSLTFAGGEFTTGTYEPAADYNERAPFIPRDLFTYVIEDNGQTTIPGGGAIVDLADERSLQAATVTITVTQTNDTPTFTTPATIEILEDTSGETVASVIQNVLPSAVTAQDETAIQTVSFAVIDSLSTVPAGLMSQPPTIDINGGITFFPAPDAVGTAIYVIRGTDDDPNDPRSTDQSITVHVRPVNDAPRFNEALIGTDPNAPLTSDINNDDDQYVIGREIDPNSGRIALAPITYTLREDNSQPVGTASRPYFIPFRQDPTVIGYNRPGLLDVFVAGPQNESDGTLGGDQQISFATGLPTTTVFGGRLTVAVENGVPVGVNYTPPLNYNNLIGGVDSFVYAVIDESIVGGETFDLASSSLTDDQLTATNIVQFNLNPVNDRPQFTINNLTPEAPEDGGRITIPNYAFNIEAAPPLTAFDEVNVVTGQDVTFSLTSLQFPATQSQQFFSEFPTISPDGTLSFTTVPDVFGSFEFQVVLTDNGEGNATRGDLISSFAETITLTIQPENDPPVINPAIAPLDFTINEDGTIDVPLNGDTVTPGLLTPFLPGPANEGEDIDPGGNQTVSLATPIASSTIEGGTLTQVLDPVSGALVALRYTPRDNFVGTDSFIYTVTDDGITIDIGTGGNQMSDPNIASNQVTFQVLPINDEPLFSGASNLVSDEDDGIITVPSWATNVQAGPATAADELASQSLSFSIVQTTGDINLFSTAPTATVIGETATLTYQSAPDANGVATFEVTLFDNGPNNATINDDNQSQTQTFTIRVNAINDAPSFTPGVVPPIAEDSGPYNELWATNILPGPSDEALQTVRFEVVTPLAEQALFQTQPTIGDDGFLRFTPATNANGTANLQVTAIDSEGGTSNTFVLQIMITEVNDSPVAQSETIDTDEDTLLIIPSAQLLANDTDPDLATNPNEFLRVQLDSQGRSFNDAFVSIDTNGDITYDPRNANLLQSLAPGENRIDSFTYFVVDSDGNRSARVTASLDVSGINDAPQLTADTPTLNPNGSTVIRPLENDFDIDGLIDPTSIEITLEPAFGSLSISDAGVITYTPFGNFSTEDTFRYSVADNLGLRSEQATITVSANAAPIARDDIGGSFLNETFEINVAANDTDPDAAVGAANRGLDLNSIVITSAPLRGDVVPLSGGLIRYVPDAGFVGADQFQYVIADIAGRFSEPATVDVRFSQSRLQNPVNFEDVNADGDISPLDALLVINRLAETGGVVPVVPGDFGPNFYDVDGNQMVTPNDILTVIEQLVVQAANNRGQGELIQDQLPQGELIQSDLLVSAGTAIDETVLDRGEEADSAFSANVRTSTASSSISDGSQLSDTEEDWIDFLADEQDAEDDGRLSALDEAFGDLI